MEKRERVGGRWKRDRERELKVRGREGVLEERERERERCLTHGTGTYVATPVSGPDEMMIMTATMMMKLMTVCNYDDGNDQWL